MVWSLEPSRCRVLSENTQLCQQRTNLGKKNLLLRCQKALARKGFPMISPGKPAFALAQALVKTGGIEIARQTQQSQYITWIWEKSGQNRRVAGLSESNSESNLYSECISYDSLTKHSEPKVIHTWNTRCEECLCLSIYCLTNIWSQHSRQVDLNVRRAASRVQAKMESTLFDTHGLILLISFLYALELECNPNGIHGQAAVSLYCIFMRDLQRPDWARGLHWE